MRTAAPTLLGLTGGAFALALAWDWATPDFWESGPILGSVVVVGVLAGLSVYAWRNRLGLAVGLGIGASILTFVATAMVAIRWAT